MGFIFIFLLFLIGCSINVSKRDCNIIKNNSFIYTTIYMQDGICHLMMSNVNYNYSMICRNDKEVSYFLYGLEYPLDQKFYDLLAYSDTCTVYNGSFLTMIN